MIKRIISVSLVIILLCFALVSCVDKNKGDDTQTPSGSKVETDPADTTRQYPDLSGINYNGSTFHIVSHDSIAESGWLTVTSDMTVEGTNGDGINDAIYERNRKIEELLNIELKITMLKSGLSVDLEKVITAGDNPYDAVNQKMNFCGVLFNKGLIQDLNDNEFDFEAPWWDNESIDTFTIGGSLFGVVSDMTYVDKLATSVTFFNQSLATDLGVPDLYDLTLAGDFTYETMLQYAKAAILDNGDGKLDENDRYGVSCQNDGSYYFLHAANILVATNDGENRPEFNLTSEKAITALEKIFEMMNNKNLYFNRQTYGMTVAQVANLFAQNKALFMFRPLQTLYDLRSLESNFGIVPMPKFYDDQKDYHCSVNPYVATVFCLPKLVDDVDMVTVAMETLAAESYYTVMPEFYDVVLDVKLVADPKISGMLDIIFDNRVYDLGMIWKFGAIEKTIVVPSMEGIASTIKAKESAVNASIDSLMTEVAKIQAAQ